MIEYPKIETLYERDEKTFKVRPAPSLEQEAEHIAEEFLAHALNRQYLTHRIPVGYLVHLMIAFATRQREGAQKEVLIQNEVLVNVRLIAERHATARRCAAIVRQHQHPQPIHQHGDCSTTIATAIRIEFGLTE